MSFQSSAKVFCFGYCSHWLWDQAETSSKVISKLKCSISYLEPLVLNEVSGVPSAELLKLQWKTSFLGLETTSQGNSAFSIRATPTICGSSEPQYGESEITLCIHEVNWISYISQEVTGFISDIPISVWSMYRQTGTNAIPNDPKIRKKTVQCIYIRPERDILILNNATDANVRTFTYGTMY